MKDVKTIKQNISKNIKKFKHHIFDIKDDLSLNASLEMIQKNTSLSLSRTIAGNYILKQNTKEITHV